MSGAREVIERIQREVSGNGIDHSRLSEDVKNFIQEAIKFKRNAVKLTDDIPKEKPHFIFELIQNAEDNEYENGVIPKIKFILTSDCLIVQNNETGFKEENVRALCSIGGSTKTNKSLGYIGEKGIGFKSVFRVANEVQIFSNDFQFRFKYDKYDPLTMLTPEWVGNIPNFVDLTQTNIIMVLNDESKAEASKYLDYIHPNLLLFLRKLRIIEIEDRKRGIYKRFERFEKDNVIEIKIEEKIGNSSKPSILRWFVVENLLTVPPKISEDKRRGVKETEIILAFPLKEDGSPDTSREQYVFAFLPVRKYGFKFIIQADFILLITRGDIKDNMWNRWVRDSIVDVFVGAVSIFKKDDKLKHCFYEYLPLDEVKDEFFLPIVEEVYKRLKEEECILTEGNKWKKPSEVLVGDEEIKKIVTNDDLHKFLGKEYLSGKIKSNRRVLDKLGVGKFSIDDLIKILKNTEWLKKQSDEWFSLLFKYLSNRKLYGKQLEDLRNLNIIRLENGELTSINKGTVFFSMEGERTYGFESELRVIRRDIISKYGKEERDEIFKFLKKLGIQEPSPYEIIENHILPIYENGMWKEKDSDILIGHIMYIKDHLDIYYEKSDRKLNRIGKWGKSKEDPLKRLKKSLLIRTDRNEYDRPENMYLPKTYGNENSLEELFEEIDVSFVHSCYLERDVAHINGEIGKLEDTLKDKSKTWKKKHKKEVKKTEKGIRKLEKGKGKKIEEWKEFFLKLGVHEMPKIEYYEGSCEVSYSHTYCDFQNRLGIPREKMEYSTRGHRIGDWRLSPEFEYILEKGNEKKIRILLAILDKYWREKYSKYLDMDYWWFYWGEHHKTFPSSFIRKLKEKIRLPTTQNTLAKPSEIFLDKPEIRKLLDGIVPYPAVKIKNEEFLEALGINTQANVDGVLSYLKALVEQKNTDKKKLEELYNFLNEHFEEDALKIKEEFNKNPLIFVPNTEKKYYTTKEIIWKDVSDVFSENRIYLEKHYPKQFKEFFVEKLGISEKPGPKDYAEELVNTSKKDKISKEDKKIVMKIYEALNRNLNPEKVENIISQEDWWKDFIREPIFLTNKSEFRDNNGDLFINDDNELYELFKDEEDIRFLYLPEKYNPSRIRHFIEACGLRYISKSVKVEPLLEEGKYPRDQELTNHIRAIVPYVLRYLYWRENSTYEKLKKGGIFRKIRVIEVHVADNLKVKYSINLNKWKTIEQVTERKCIYYNGSLYIRRNNASLNDLAVEFSKVFGEVKGLDSFLLLIINIPLSEIEKIMEIQKIGELPKNEAESLGNIIKTEEVAGKKEELLSEKEPEKTFSEEESESSKEIPASISMASTSQLPAEPTRGENGIERNKGIPDKKREKEWTSEFSPKDVPVVVEEYDVQKQGQIEGGREKHGKRPPMGNTHVEITPSRGETLSRKTREDIGRWGEEYALRCIKEELLKKHADVTVVKDTGQGFKLERDCNVVVEVIWENKEGEKANPYDIKIIEKEKGEEIYIEVKTTASTSKETFQLSENEWHFMQEKGDNYWIYRVYGAGSKSPKAIKMQNPIKLIYEGTVKIKTPITIEI